jgi:dTDP-4-dehydrorhamnose reductase
MRVVVTGAAGQLGAELCHLLGSAAVPIDLDRLDLAHAPSVAKTIPELAPDVVINCAAYTQVDHAESDPGVCRMVNAMAVKYLADACSKLDCPLVQISTDYVFAGSNNTSRPRSEEDPPGPLGIYAVTKYEGEQAAARHAKHIIVRTCGLYARPSHQEARNFVKTIFRFARSRPQLRVVSDQHCTPSYVPHLARAVLFLAGAETGQAAPWGLYHVTNQGATTWYDFAREIVRLAGIDVEIVPISTAEYGAAAPRPAYSVLDTTKYHRLSGPAMPDWRVGLAEYFEEMGRPQI